MKPDQMTPDEIIAALAAPFDPSEVKFKPGVVSGNRALALVYVDARVIQDRLDEVLGVAGWQDEYECLPDGSVVCRLRCRLGNDWIMKMDVGSPSEQPDEGDRRKAAFSDSLKRAAVKFGIGRYLYRLPSQWVDYDPHKRKFLRTPALPVPAKKTTPATTQPANGSPAGPPATGSALLATLATLEAQMVQKGWCGEGDLLAHLAKVGRGRKYPAKIGEWAGDAITFAIEEARRWKDARREVWLQAKKEQERQDAEAEGVL